MFLFFDSSQKNKMPRPARKTAVAPKLRMNPKLDIYHNRFDQPCSRFLQEITDEIIIVKEHECTLASAIRHYLQTEIMTLAAASSTSNQQTNKKKKKKKKKKVDENVKDKNDDDNNNTVELARTESSSTTIQNEENNNEHPTTTPVESMSRRKRLLYNFLAQHNTSVATTTAAPSSLQSFVDYLTLTPVKCVIQSAAVQQALNDISCESCRQCLQDHVNQKSIIPLNFAGNNSTDTEAHFDYVAMEEGLGQATERWSFVRESSSPSRGSSSNKEREGAWELRYSIGSSEECLIPWKWEHFLLFLENGILQPALSVDDVFGFDRVDKVLSKTVVTDIIAKVYRLCERKENSFCKWAQQLSTVTTTFEDQTAMHHVGGNIEMSSFAVMKSTDETCQELLRYLFALMWEMTQHSLSAIRFSRQFLLTNITLVDEATDEERHQWPLLQAQRREDQDSSVTLAKVVELWQAYSKTIQIIAVESGAYEKNVGDQANAQGSIPAMYCSSAVRELYRQLVKTKIRAIYHLIDDFQETLDSEVNLLDPLLGKDAAWNISWYRYMIAHNAYQEDLRDHQERRKKKNGSTLSLDEMLETVITAVSKWIAESIHQGTVQKVLMEHEQRRKTLCSQVEKLVETGERHVVNYTRAAPVLENSSALFLNELKGLRDDLSDVNYPTDISSFDCEEAILKLSTLRSKLWKRCATLVSYWLQCSASLDLEKKDVAVQKYDYGWLTLASTTELPFALKKELCLQQTGQFEGICPGGNGNFRVECTLLGLLYRWMDERYKHWQAFVAEEELLHGMSNEIVEAPPKAVLGKKNKKKKTSTKKSEMQGPADSMPEAGISIGNDPDLALATPVRNAIEPETNSVQDKNTSALKQPDLLHLSHQKDEGQKLAEEEPKVPPDNESIPITNVSSSRKEVSSIGVLDDEKFESAEAFLVGRLMIVMSSLANTTYISS